MGVCLRSTRDTLLSVAARSSLDPIRSDAPVAYATSRSGGSVILPTRPATALVEDRSSGTWNLRGQSTSTARARRLPSPPSGEPSSRCIDRIPWTGVIGGVPVGAPPLSPTCMEAMNTHTLRGRLKAAVVAYGLGTVAAAVLWRDCATHVCRLQRSCRERSSNQADPGLIRIVLQFKSCQACQLVFGSVGRSPSVGFIKLLIPPGIGSLLGSYGTI